MHDRRFPEGAGVHLSGIAASSRWTRRPRSPYALCMIFLHETHDVVAGKMEEFWDALRGEWRPLVEADGTARILWAFELTHGTGASYQAITITAVRDWSAWGALAGRDDARARDWRRRSGTLRHEVTAKLLLAATWSPLATVDLASAPAAEHPPALYLHDTGWPFPGGVDDYVDALGSIYYPQVRQSQMISVEACWRVAPGTGRLHEAILLQKILDWPRFTELLARGEQGAQRGGWMAAGLTYRDRWESKLLRTASWSPRG